MDIVLLVTTLGTILENVYDIILGLDVGIDLGSSYRYFYVSNDVKL